MTVVEWQSYNWRRLLDHLVEHAPEEYRESMLKNVRLYREIMKAWASHGSVEE